MKKMTEDHKFCSSNSPRATQQTSMNTGGVMQFYLSAIDRGLPALNVMAHCFIAVSAVEFSIVR